MLLASIAYLVIPLAILHLRGCFNVISIGYSLFKGLKATQLIKTHIIRHIHYNSLTFWVKFHEIITPKIGKCLSCRLVIPRYEYPIRFISCKRSLTRNDISRYHLSHIWVIQVETISYCWVTFSILVDSVPESFILLSCGHSIIVIVLLSRNNSLGIRHY